MRRGNTVNPREAYCWLPPAPSEVWLFCAAKPGTSRVRWAPLRIIISFINSALKTEIAIGVFSRGRETSVPEVDSVTSELPVDLTTKGDSSTTSCEEALGADEPGASCAKSPPAQKADNRPATKYRDDNFMRLGGIKLATRMGAGVC